MGAGPIAMVTCRLRSPAFGASGWKGLAPLAQDLMQQVRAVGDDPVYPEIDKVAHLRRRIYHPDNKLKPGGAAGIDLGVRDKAALEGHGICFTGAGHRWQ